MINLYEKYQCSIVAIEEIPFSRTNKYGIVDGTYIDYDKTLLRLNNIVEKPETKDEPSNLAIIGRYILTPDIFDILRNTKPGEETPP